MLLNCLDGVQQQVIVESQIKGLYRISLRYVACLGVVQGLHVQIATSVGVAEPLLTLSLGGSNQVGGVKGSVGLLGKTLSGPHCLVKVVCTPDSSLIQGIDEVLGYCRTFCNPLVSGYPEEWDLKHGQPLRRLWRMQRKSMWETIPRFLPCREPSRRRKCICA